MSIVLDIIVITIIVATTLITMKKGFVKTILSLASWFLTLILVSSFGGAVAEFAYDSFIEEKVVAAVEEPINKQLESSEEAIESIFDSLPSFIASSAEKNGVGTENLIEEISDGKTPNDIAVAVNNNIVEPTVLPMLVIVVDIIMFTVLMFVFRIVTKLVCTLFKAPVLKSVNKYLGAGLGVIKGLLISMLVATIISFVATYGFGGQFLIFTEDAIEGSYLFGKLADILELALFG